MEESMIDTEEYNQMSEDILEYICETSEIKDIEHYQKSLEKLMEISRKIDKEFESYHENDQKMKENKL